MRPAYCPITRSFRPFSIYRRSALAPGDLLEGPAIIEEPDTSIVVATPESIEVLENGCILVTARQRGEAEPAARVFGEEFAEMHDGDAQ